MREQTLFQQLSCTREALCGLGRGVADCWYTVLIPSDTNLAVQSRQRWRLR